MNTKVIRIAIRAADLLIDLLEVILAWYRSAKEEEADHAGE